MIADTLLVVSYYDRRPVEHLWRLFRSLSYFDPGRAIDVCIVINRTGSHEIALPHTPRLVGTLERENLGMNIGAWDAGWRKFDGYGTYIFFQDECYPVRHGWGEALASAAEQPGTGLVGESLNARWDQAWAKLRELQAAVQLAEHLVDGKPENRVDTYLDFFQRKGIPRGTGGRHLRALVWAARRTVLEQIGGFPIGGNYGECIGAEIGTSKRVEALGLAVRQVATEPFRYIRHREWNQDRPGGLFVHSAPPAHLLHAPQWATDRWSLGVLPWSATLRRLFVRLRHTLKKRSQSA
ncbi:MAG: hypothetical protein ACSLE5_14980 [Porticoccaceae bacterium]